MRYPLVLGETLGEERAFHDRVVAIALPVGRLGVRQVGDAQQQVAQLRLQDVEIGGERRLAIAQRPAVGLQLLGACRVALATLQPHLLRQLVDLGAEGVACGLQLAYAGLHLRRLGQLREHFVVVTAGQRGTHTVGVGTQKSNVDHVLRLVRHLRATPGDTPAPPRHPSTTGACRQGRDTDRAGDEGGR